MVTTSSHVGLWRDHVRSPRVEPTVTKVVTTRATQVGHRHRGCGGQISLCSLAANFLAAMKCKGIRRSMLSGSPLGQQHRGGAAEPQTAKSTTSREKCQLISSSLLFPTYFILNADPLSSKHYRVKKLFKGTVNKLL